MEINSCTGIHIESDASCTATVPADSTDDFVITDDMTVMHGDPYSVRIQ
ncbi:hypothetical protein [Ruminococcus flavefaciens]|uniref:Uncharacterized protein n=1 Tax=Ruminococcus flavefaciens 007c TaxID=1341157 RepID=W7UIA3_RUMFL|nr:hypothetical protein [Ruminococcus flavefaciens]EWM54976.1 hypothetical protein RF007C_02995 [Ruminococcus flavefaciens 007c]